MLAPVNRLRARTVASLKNAGLYADGAGLHLRISRTGSKRWVFIYSFGKRRREMSLGSISKVGLGEARELAARSRGVVSVGRDPIAERRGQSATRSNDAEITFEEIMDDLVADLKLGWKNNVHRRQWRATLIRHAYPLLQIPVSKINSEMIVKTLKPIWFSQPNTGWRVRQRIARVLAAARARGLDLPLRISSTWS